jgi:hypothetical protein
MHWVTTLYDRIARNIYNTRLSQIHNHTIAATIQGEKFLSLARRVGVSRAYEGSERRN